MAAREQEDREASPTADVSDSQSVKTTESGGFDAGKKVMGRMRYIVVDTLGLMIGLVIHAADVQGRDSVPVVLNRSSNAGSGCVMPLPIAATADRS